MMKQLLLVSLLVPVLGFSQVREMGEIRATGFPMEQMSNFYRQLEELVTNPKAIGKHVLYPEDFFKKFSDSICLDLTDYKNIKDYPKEELSEWKEVVNQTRGKLEEIHGFSDPYLYEVDMSLYLDQYIMIYIEGDVVYRAFDEDGDYVEYKAEYEFIYDEVKDEFSLYLLQFEE